MDNYTVLYENQIFKEPTALQFWIDLFWMTMLSIEIMYVWFFILPEAIIAML